MYHVLFVICIYIPISCIAFGIKYYYYYYKKDIVTGIKLVDKSISDLMWLKRDKQKFGLEKDLFLYFVYIPPANSSYTLRTDCDKQLFEKLDQDITKYSVLGDIILMWDLNAHINKNYLRFYY